MRFSLIKLNFCVLSSSSKKHTIKTIFFNYIYFFGARQITTVNGNDMDRVYNIFLYYYYFIIFYREYKSHKY